MNLDEQIKMAESLRQPAEDSLAGQSELKPVHPPEVNKMEYDIPTGAGETKVWVFKPVKTLKQPLPVFVNLHGGGFILGSAEMDNHWCPVISLSMWSISWHRNTLFRPLFMNATM